MTVLEGLRDFFKQSGCRKMIRYDARTINIAAIGVGIPGYTANLSKIRSELKEVRQASESALALDDFAYAMCNLRKGLDRNNPRYWTLFDLQAAVLCLFASFRMTLVAFENDPKGTEGKLQALISRMEALCDHLLAQDKQGYPPSEIRFGGPGVPDDPVTRAFMLVGLSRIQIREAAS